MPGYRSRKETLKYRSHLKQLSPKRDCEFCILSHPDNQMIKTYDNFKLVRNIFPYSHWDGTDVADHLMLIPNIHTDTLSDLSEEAAIEYVRLLGEYDQQGYSSYARAPSSMIKTVVHHHTHLIKPGNERRRLFIYSKKPYIRMVV